MPKRTDLKSICIIGAGPIVIGQACEFDYSGVQACKALREEGYRVILVNSNPATIMTDPDMADATYIEPITPDFVTLILEKERPDALLPTMGGQTALNTALALAKNGTLKRLNIELIGAKIDAIEKAEDRQLFRQTMDAIGLESPRSQVVRTYDEAVQALENTGLPAIIRPSFTLAGTGGGIAYNRIEFEDIVRGGLRASPVGEVLIEESVLGWKEFEMEVVRDRNDNAIIICAIENIDPMGIHTGDSITVAPALTLTDKEYQRMRDASIAVLRAIGVETGGSNVQFAVNPADGRMVVIEMNPRVSRSSALASKATGFPIAKIAAKLAVGYTLDELKNDMTGTPASFEPTIDYVVTKIPRFTFEKFPGTDPILTTSMKSVGEVMAVGRCFEESLQKALRGLETGLTGLNEMPIGDGENPDPLHIRAALSKPTPDRLLLIAQAFRHGMSVEDVHHACKVDPWFLRKIEHLVKIEAEIRIQGLDHYDTAGLQRLKHLGFSDARLAQLTLRTEAEVRSLRKALKVHPVYKRIDTCAAEFASTTPYMYSTYEPAAGAVCESAPSDRKKVVILGGGPNRIGQGIEFDYCCVHAVMALRGEELHTNGRNNPSTGKPLVSEPTGEAAARAAESSVNSSKTKTVNSGSRTIYETIMVNCNPETVSTDYDTSDRLYFEPLTAEDVIELIHAEQRNGTLHGVIVQFGGQTPLKLAHALETAGIPILGTSVDAIDLAEDRERFQKLLHQLKLKQPDNGLARSLEEAEKVATRIGFPVVIRPSYVLGGRAMEIVHDMAGLHRYIRQAVQVSGSNPVLIDRYLQDAIEVDVDVIADGQTTYIAGIMEHIEEAGIHSGDSACALPPFSLSPALVDDIGRQARALAQGLKVRGLMNIQFAIKDNDVYVLEVNPRASRTVPFVAKATGVPVAKIAARVMAGESLASFGLKEKTLPYTAVKEAVFPFARFPGVDVIGGPEMKSTGEVMGLDKDFGRAFAKAQLGAGVKLPTSGTVFISVKDRDKAAFVIIAQQLIDLGYTIMATGGTATHLASAGIPVTRVNKVLEGQPHIVDAIINGQVQMVLNTTEGAQSMADSFSIRRTALMNSVPYYTTVSEARAIAGALKALKNKDLDVMALQKYAGF